MRPRTAKRASARAGTAPAEGQRPVFMQGFWVYFFERVCTSFSGAYWSERVPPMLAA